MHFNSVRGRVKDKNVRRVNVDPEPGQSLLVPCSLAVLPPRSFFLALFLHILHAFRAKCFALLAVQALGICLLGALDQLRASRFFGHSHFRRYLSRRSRRGGRVV